MLLTVAGSSCSGKTTAARAGVGLAGLVVHDFDEVGVPTGADTAWRQRSLEGWLRRALDYQRAGLDMLLLGQSPLGEVLACPSATDLDGVTGLLLDVADEERLLRLERRDPGRWSDQAKQAFLGWAGWHRGHAADPRHQPAAIIDGGWPPMRWDRWINWPTGDSRWQVAVQDTTGLSSAESAAALRRWVTAVQAG